MQYDIFAHMGYDLFCSFNIRVNLFVYLKSVNRFIKVVKHTYTNYSFITNPQLKRFFFKMHVLFLINMANRLVVLLKINWPS